MDYNKKNICRLCLKICESERRCEAIEATALQMLISLLNLDLAISDEPIMCAVCSDNLKQCFEYKVACLSTKDFVDDKGYLEDIVKEVPQSQNVDETAVNVLGGYITCYFCLKPTKNDSLVFVNNENAQNMIISLERYFPELDLNFKRERIMCMPCYESLQCHCSFITNCMSVEEKIKKYCEIEGTNSKGQVDLGEVLLFASNNMMESKDASCGIHDIKLEGTWHDEMDNTSGLSVAEMKNEGCIKVEEHEFSVKEAEKDVKMEENGDDSCYESGHLLLPKEEHHVSFMTKCTERCTSKPIMNDHQQHEFTLKEETHDTSKVEVHKLTPKTASRTVRMSETCADKSENKKDTQKSTTNYKNISEASVHSCEICKYQFKRKSSLQKHMLNHKSTSEVTMYKCEHCPYQSRHKDNLQRHTLVHKSISEVTMHKCELCECQFKHKVSLLKHMLNHKSTSEVTIHKCELCPYQSRHKRNFQKHTLVHKSFAEITAYKCEICSFQFKRKFNLQMHMLNHKSTSEITMHKCEFCPYQSRHKNNYQRHALVHKSISEITAYKCGMCKCLFKHKFSLRRHMLDHKNSSEVTMFKCDLCPYQSKHKDNLRSHMVVHKSFSEVTAYKCEMCTYQTKRKHHLQLHVLNHKGGK